MSEAFGQSQSGRESLEQKSGVDTSEPPELATKHSEREGVSYGSRPPPTSVFTQPLQTIPSQAVLPTEDAFKPEEKHHALSRALSCLEGTVSQQGTDVDQQTLMHMFGHLNSSLESYKKTSATLSQNAAAAEKYLAQYRNIDTEATGPDKPAESTALNHQGQKDANRPKSESNCTGKRKRTMVSKWSDSTPSDKDISPVAEGLVSHEPLPSIDASDQISATKNHSNADETASLVQPPRIPVATNVLPVETQESEHTNGAANDATDFRRGSSPTIVDIPKSKKKPGSVRVAREGIQAPKSSYSRTTVAAESKRATRKPTPHTNTLLISDHEPRGRTLSSQKPLSRDANDTAPKVSVPTRMPDSSSNQY